MTKELTLSDEAPIQPDAELASFSFRYPEQLNSVLNAMEQRGLNPESKILDYCAGNGSVARGCIDRGYNNVVCLDRNKPNDFLVPQDYFRFIDLIDLVTAIARGDKVPDEIEQMRGSYDFLVGMQVAELPLYVHRQLALYFLKPGGYLFCDHSHLVHPDFEEDGVFYRYLPKETSA